MSIDSNASRLSYDYVDIIHIKGFFFFLYIYDILAFYKLYSNVCMYEQIKRKLYWARYVQ